jgi:hypothetical protein
MHRLRDSPVFSRTTQRAKLENRKAATTGVSTEEGMDRDEYPFACCKEGGKGASVEHVPSSDNRSAGGQLGQQVKDLAPGTKIEVVVEKK